MTTYHEFDEVKVREALDAIKANGDLAEATYARDLAEGGAHFAEEEYSVLAQCISVTIENHKIGRRQEVHYDTDQPAQWHGGTGLSQHLHPLAHPDRREGNRQRCRPCRGDEDIRQMLI